MKPTDAGDFSTLWTVFSKCKSHLENGLRLENMSWRMWFHESRRQQIKSLERQIQPQHTSSSVPPSSRSPSIQRFLSSVPVNPQPPTPFTNISVAITTTAADPSALFVDVIHEKPQSEPTFLLNDTYSEQDSTDEEDDDDEPNNNDKMLDTVKNSMEGDSETHMTEPCIENTNEVSVSTKKQISDVPTRQENEETLTLFVKTKPHRLPRRSLLSAMLNNQSAAKKPMVPLLFQPTLKAYNNARLTARPCAPVLSAVVVPCLDNLSSTVRSNLGWEQRHGIQVKRTIAVPDTLLSCDDSFNHITPASQPSLEPMLSCSVSWQHQPFCGW
ncbi:uncharacterized protein BYT42DRAFT_611144 [Radiomyces spectabilis]|uniref:uncharacterized protein n=1 Tax=Radiomyces spectabilis TaxID=64574 RepID=UPI00221F8C77|nr:uncharacterized protein BYT42DRAFT_611144 [Radiomyces spectabilis]KAI8388066.1 hypothetical protein BYT42DRAFT_611144 [Radiomyces spectabilis]